MTLVRNIMQFLLELNLINVIFIIFSVTVIVTFVILNIISRFIVIPECIKEISKYGKLDSDQTLKSFVAKFQVPKM